MDDPNATDPSEARVFSSVISGLQKNYPREKMEEISTSFCFICLLHLANEQGLKLECAPDGKLPSVVDEAVDDEEVSVVDKKVGNLWDLKVCPFKKIGNYLLIASFRIRCTGIHMLRLLHNQDRAGIRKLSIYIVSFLHYYTIRVAPQTVF